MHAPGQLTVEQASGDGAAGLCAHLAESGMRGIAYAAAVAARPRLDGPERGRSGRPANDGGAAGVGGAAGASVPVATIGRGGLWLILWAFAANAHKHCLTRLACMVFGRSSLAAASCGKGEAKR